jgi:hypothetical protein
MDRATERNLIQRVNIGARRRGGKTVLGLRYFKPMSAKF